MTAMIGTSTLLCWTAALGGCDAELPLVGEPAPAAQEAPALLVAEGECGSVEVSVGGRDRVTAVFPDPDACEGAPVLVPAGDPSYDRPGGGRLELPVGVRNATGEAVVLPARLLLPPEGAEILFPPGLARNDKKRVEALGPDGVVPEGEPHAGAWFWEVGEPGVLEAGETSAGRVLELTVPNGVQRFRLGFRVEAGRLSTDWPELPLEAGSWFPLMDGTKLVDTIEDDPEAAVYFRTDVLIGFEPHVSDLEKAAFFARHSLTVLAQVPTTGNFYVRMPDPGPTIEDYLNATDVLQAEPETRYVVSILRYGHIPVRSSRFPADGSGQMRTDWLDGSRGTWGMRAVRAPQAWGCETGLYGSVPVRVGVLEWAHQRAHPEFARSGPSLWEPPVDSVLAQAPPFPDDSVRMWEAHGVAVTGALTAEGDNRSGLAGMMWRSNLGLYAGLSPGRRGIHLADDFFAIARELVTDGVQVLNLSTDVRPPRGSRSAQIERDARRLANDIQGSLLERLPDLVVVVSTGNDRLRQPVSAYIRDSRTHLITGALLLLREENPAYRDRIIVVAGTQEGNRFWRDSNFFRGETDVAAPARNVTVLDRWTGQVGAAVPLTRASGTSYAAPLVAGTAGLLLSMDPTLTPAQVKDYILRGAQVRRIDPATGDSVPAQPVQGAPEDIYQLDAYGALTLLSRERPRTPICGFPVAVRGTDVVLERPAGTEVIPIPVAEEVYAPSLARGGRRMAVTAFHPSDGVTRVHVFDHRGAFEQTLLEPVIERRFLERDTVDVIHAVHPGGGFRPFFTYLPSRPGIPAQYDPFAVVNPNAEGVIAEFYEFNPTGDSIALLARYHLGGGQRRLASDLVDVPAGTAAPIREAFFDDGVGPCTNCEREFLDIASARWSHGGRTLVFVLPRADVVPEDDLGDPIIFVLAQGQGSGFGVEVARRSTVLVRSPTGETETTVEGWWLLHPRFKPDDSVITFREQNLEGGCEATRRLTASVGAWRHQVSVGPEECDLGLDFALPHMLAPPLVAGAGNGPLVSEGDPRTGAPYLTPEQASLLEYLRRRPARIQVN